MMIKFKKLDPQAIIPTRAHSDDLGLDLYALEDVSMSPHSNKLIRTGVACEFPSGIGGILKDRSSVASKQRLYVKAGVIDPAFRGEILVLIDNSNGYTCPIKAGTKIAQMVLVESIQMSIIEVEELNDTTRGSSGFGSSGA